jgi:hypothetical protein
LEIKIKQYPSRYGADFSQKSGLYAKSRLEIVLLIF